MHYSRLNPPLNPAQIDLLDDVRAVQNAILEELSQNPEVDVVVLSHSSGTVVASAAVESLDKATRVREGHRNGVAAFLIMTGIIVPPGNSTLEWAGGEVPPTVELTSIADPLDVARRIEVTKPIADPGAVALFYHDMTDAEEAKRYAGLCTHQIMTVNTTKVPFAGWKVPDLKVYYLVCEEDRALPAAFQRVMIENANRDRAAETGSKEGGSHAEVGNSLEKFQKDSLAAVEVSKTIIDGVKAGNKSAALAGSGDGKDEADIEQGHDALKIHVTSIKSGHSPFLSRVEETAQWVRRCSGEVF
jgi:hypothetical protein